MIASKKFLPAKKPFEPFELKIVVETEEEARGLYAIFNHVENLSLLPESSREIRHVIGEKFQPDGGEIAFGVSYDKFYRFR